MQRCLSFARQQLPGIHDRVSEPRPRFTWRRNATERASTAFAEEVDERLVRTRMVDRGAPSAETPKPTCYRGG